MHGWRLRWMLGRRRDPPPRERTMVDQDSNDAACVAARLVAGRSLERGSKLFSK